MTTLINIFGTLTYKSQEFEFNKNNSIATYTTISQ